jgi:hypothetical protein
VRCGGTKATVVCQTIITNTPSMLVYLRDALRSFIGTSIKTAFKLSPQTCDCVTSLAEVVVGKGAGYTI